MHNLLIKMRDLASVLLKDIVFYEEKLFFCENKYLELRNRLERLASGPDGLGYVCLWPYTSRLHAPLFVPYLGRRLLGKCLINNGFSFKEERNTNCDIDISVLIGHRGLARLPLLLLTLKSIAAQKGVSLECIVIEQDTKPKVINSLPNWIKYLFNQVDNKEGIYNRSAAFNYGARYAKGKILILHDNDMLMPENYCKEMMMIHAKGYEAINIKRFIFYLSQPVSQRILESVNNLTSVKPDYIVQNLEAGGSIAISREAYFSIGGMDEEFVGWGGEDIEFWQRCSILRRWIWGYLPIIHLWHESQPLKEKPNNPNIKRFEYLDNISLHKRILYLVKKNWAIEKNG